MSSSSKDSPKAPSESSDLSEPDSPPEITSSAVLFRGPPLSLFPSVARHIASKLALSPPSPLKVLDGASFTSGKRYPDCYGTLPQTYELKCEDSMTGSTTEGNRRNSYAVQIVSGTGKRKVDYHNEHWDTIEAPNVVCPSPPSQMLSLFDGFLLYASDTLGEYKTELEDVFELFGGSVIDELSSPPESNITHFVAPKSSYATSGCNLRSFCGLALDGVAVHPSWITCSIENGFLLPTSLFSLEPSNSSFRAIPRTNGYGDISAFFTNDQKPPVPVHFVSSRIPSLPEETRACFVGRRFFFDLDASQHRQLVQALSSVVSRMGGEVVSQLPLCDWVVTSKRSGAAYLYGLRHPEIIMGTLQHLMANIKANGENPINPRSNMLYYPIPTDYTHPLAKQYIRVFVSKRYPSEYRRYLSSLFRAMTGYPPLSSGSQLYDDGILIAPCSNTLYEEDKISAQLDLRNRVLRPRFLEQSFLNHKSKNIYNVDTKTFRDSKYESFAPRKLPLEFENIEFHPSRVPVEFLDDLSDLETRWELHEKCEGTKTGCKCSSCEDLW